MAQGKREYTDMMKDIRAARAAYARAWRQKNPEKQAAIVRRYWTKKIREMQEQENSTDDHGERGE